MMIKRLNDGKKRDKAVVLFEIKNDQTVREALRRLRPHVFTKGGDRCSPETIPKWDVCQELGIRVETGIGEPKNWSSSEFLARWKEEKNKQPLSKRH